MMLHEKCINTVNIYIYKGGVIFYIFILIIFPQLINKTM